MILQNLASHLAQPPGAAFSGSPDLKGSTLQLKQLAHENPGASRKWPDLHH